LSVKQSAHLSGQEERLFCADGVYELSQALKGARYLRTTKTSQKKHYLTVGKFQKEQHGPTGPRRHYAETCCRKWERGGRELWTPVTYCGVQRNYNKRDLTKRPIQHEILGVTARRTSQQTLKKTVRRVNLEEEHVRKYFRVREGALFGTARTESYTTSLHTSSERQKTAREWEPRVPFRKKSERKTGNLPEGRLGDGKGETLLENKKKIIKIITSQRGRERSNTAKREIGAR